MEKWLERIGDRIEKASADHSQVFGWLLFVSLVYLYITCNGRAY